MGALHDGHMALVAEAVRRADEVVVTIFVNPTQFGPGEDLDRYPRTLDADVERCTKAGASLVFAPKNVAMYPPGDETRVRVGATASELCGAHRPGHFEGVTTVVAKLFALVGPCVAVFGRKDYQQWRVIERMTRDLMFPVEVIAAPTVREPDGLALSSRNAYLTAEQRSRALCIPRALSAACRAFDSGERTAGVLRQIALSAVTEAMDSVDYVEVAAADTAQTLAADAVIADRALLAIAARVGSTRLIDNVVLGEDAAPLAR
jgi:pantoate--beta-alanine ligase